MLILTRKLGEGILIRLDPRADPSMLVSELFASGPIKISVLKIAPDGVRLAVTADPRLLVQRDRPDE